MHPTTRAVAEAKVLATIELLRKNPSTTWRDVAKALNCSKCVASRAIAVARERVKEKASASLEKFEDQRERHLIRLLPRHIAQTERLMDIVSAKQDELYDAENQRLRERPIFNKDGEEVGSETASVAEIKGLVESWSKTHAYLESVSGEDVRKKQAANKTKPAKQVVHATNAVVVGHRPGGFWDGFTPDKGSDSAGEGSDEWLPELED